METLQKELNNILGTVTPASTASAAPKKHKMSPAAKAKLSAKLNEVWANRKAAEKKWPDEALDAQAAPA